MLTQRKEEKKGGRENWMAMREKGRSQDLLSGDDKLN
jgi:hypothetical protein